MRFHPVRLVILAAAVAAIWATYQEWIWIGGLGGLNGAHLGVWTGGHSWLTAAGIQDGYATMAIAVSTVPFAVFGKRAERLHRGASVYVLLAGIGLATFVALETARMLHTREIAPDKWWAQGTDLGTGVFVLGACALALIAAGFFPPRPRPLRPYVEPEYRL